MSGLWIALVLAQDVGIDPRLKAEVPLELRFQDEQGKTLTLREALGGRPALVAPVSFRCSGVCSQVLDALAGSLGRRAEGTYRILAVGLDPRETPAQAASRREELGASGPAWAFLTGETAELARAAGYRYALDPRTDRYVHPAAVIVLTPEGRVSRYFVGAEYRARDLRRALAEASEGRTGSFTEKLLLLCTQYDPSTGRYRPTVLGILRLGGLATAGLLAGFIGLMILRERRARSRR